MEDFYYRKLKVYHLAKELVDDVYSLAKSFPKTEQYGLTSQLCRAVISIPSNIAEGMGRFSKKERVHFLEVAYGSLMETMCQLEIAEMLEYISEEQIQGIETKVTNASKMLISLRKAIENKITN